MLLWSFDLVNVDYSLDDIDIIRSTAPVMDVVRLSALQARELAVDLKVRHMTSGTILLLVELHGDRTLGQQRAGLL
jgi:hypothetical protein